MGTDIDYYKYDQSIVLGIVLFVVVVLLAIGAIFLVGWRKRQARNKRDREVWNSGQMNEAQ